MKGRVEQNSGEYGRLRRMSWAYAIGVAILVAALVFTLWFQGIQITDNGMAPVLQKGDILLFDKLAKHAATPRRGDAYAFENQGGGVSIGRIVGLPGERVQIVAGSVYINGVGLDESRYAVHFDAALAETTLGQGAFFLMPDDRTVAVLDADAMTVPFSKLIGRAAVRVSPWSRICLFWVA
ncbi:MAG: signal peptidase I [Clostridia bacterium]|nr:signal peptidase I [Candidatus Pelethousia sp.]NCB31517.1 signal peptidase I [Clostridia bacterium]